MIILVIVLVLFGAKRMPEIGASIGKGIREFKKNINDVERSIARAGARRARLAARGGRAGAVARHRERGQHARSRSG